MPTVGGLVENNQVNGQQEESISIDGFGNNASLIPVIANGTIYSAQNDSLGRLVMSLKGMTLNGSTAATVSARNDWSNFYFCFGQNSGMEGAFVKIEGVNAAANTVTLDTIVASSAIKNGGNAGVESGAFYWTIRNNRVSNTLGANNTYGTALSIYLNVFGTLVENNTVTNCAHGINVAGGIMINGLNTLAYHNIVRNNTFTNCDKYGSGNPSEDIGVIRFVSYWGTGPLQYNNQFVNNTVNGGRVFIERQRNFVETGNTYNNVTRLAIDGQ